MHVRPKRQKPVRRRSNNPDPRFGATRLLFKKHMLFKYREKPGLAERMRLMFWPRRTVGRSARYYRHRVMRITASPHAISAGFAAGVAASITPFIGLHFLLSFVIAFFVRGNMLAAALGTTIGNPLTFPFIWAGTFKFGNWITGGGNDVELKTAELSTGLFGSSLESLWPVLQTMLVGCLPLAIGAGFLSYFLLRRGLGSYREARIARLQAKRARTSAAAGTLSQ